MKKPWMKAVRCGRQTLYFRNSHLKKAGIKPGDNITELQKLHLWQWRFLIMQLQVASMSKRMCLNT